MSGDAIKTVAVLGAGDMGHGIAESALIAGFTVHLYDIEQKTLDRGVHNINNSLLKFVSKDIVSQERYDRVFNCCLKQTTKLDEAVDSADLVIEAIPEELSLKLTVFKELDRLSPSHAILASNSSTIPITKIAEVSSRPETVLGLHYFNPAVLMKLVEVIKGDKTSEKTMDTACEFVLKNDKVPVRVKKDVPGFIVNRTQAPGGVLLNCILDQQLAEPEEVDAVFRSQGNPMGPFETIDYTGVDINYKSMMYMAEFVHPDFAPGKTISGMVKKGELGKKTGKGFFSWNTGRPGIDLEKTSDAIEPLDFIAVNANEAVKLIDMGVCSAHDVDTAIVNATGITHGLMETANKMGAEEMINRLTILADRFSKEIFKPATAIRKIISS